MNVRINPAKRDIIQDFSEFSGISIKDIKENMQNFHALSNQEWDALPHEMYEKKAGAFYANAKTCIYDLLVSNHDQKLVVDKLNGFNPRILKLIKNHPGKKFLEFGGGLGVFCELVSQLGKEVTYLDIPGLVSDFAIWRFKKYQLPINTIINEPQTLPDLNTKFDIIFSDAVLEHVINPEGIVEKLCNLLTENGILILLVDLNDSGDFHMHRTVDIHGLHNLIENQGLINVSGRNSFCSIWSKKFIFPEFNFRDLLKRTAKKVISYIKSVISRRLMVKLIIIKMSLQYRFFEKDKTVCKFQKIKEKTIIYVLCPDINDPSGGIKYLYRHSDVLNKNGFPAAICHDQPGFRCSWFSNNTNVIYRNEIKPESKDFLIVPEIYGPHLSDIYPGVKKVILNQNAFYTFNDYSLDKNILESAYLNEDIVAVFCTSEHINNSLKYVFPDLRTFIGHYGINNKIFVFNARKKNQIPFMPRKLSKDVLQVINILKFRGAVKGFELKAIDNLSETKVGQILKESMFFLSFSDREGFGLPPVEAMACGCVVIGYTGIAGKEFFKDEFSYPVEQSNVFEFGQTVEAVLKEYELNKNLIMDKGRKASEFVLKNYTPDREEDDIIKFWRTIIK